MKLLRYSELIQLQTFKERFEYLRLDGRVGESTFGFERYLNQKFYTSSEWRKIRNEIILRDNGNDLAIDGEPILGKIYIHHINPITALDIERQSDSLMSSEFLICTSFITHNAIHYGDETLLPKTIIERKPYDTCPWRKY